MDRVSQIICGFGLTTTLTVAVRTSNEKPGLIFGTGVFYDSCSSATVALECAGHTLKALGVGSALRLFSVCVCATSAYLLRVHIGLVSPNVNFFPLRCFLPFRVSAGIIKVYSHQLM